jgi:hypothetical protein
MTTKQERRHWVILNAVLLLEEHKHNGPGTTREIADLAKLSINGVSQTLNILDGSTIKRLGGKGNDTRWKLIRLKPRKIDELHRAYIREPDPEWVIRNGKRVRLTIR